MMLGQSDNTHDDNSYGYNSPTTQHFHSIGADILILQVPTNSIANKKTKVNAEGNKNILAQIAK